MSSKKKKPHVMNGDRTRPDRPDGGDGNGDEAAGTATLPGGGKECKNGIRDAESRLNAALDEVQIRFVMNLPPAELASVDRLFFQLEQAWWWYEDFLADNDDTLPHFSQQKFERKMFQHCPLLQPLHGQYDALQKNFLTWKGKIPVVGCILLNHSRKKVLLVKNWKGNGRTFPRGKMNENESCKDAAVREVQEETGFNPAPLMENCQKIELVVNGQKHILFIVPGVPDYFPFMPQVRKEISEVEWFPIDDLPKHTYGVLPFISLVNKWILKEQGKKEKTVNAAASVEKAQQLMEGRGEVPKSQQSSTSKVVSVSKRKQKFGENKAAAPATSNGATSASIGVQQVTNGKEIVTNKHDNGLTKRDERVASDQKGIMLSSTACNVVSCRSAVSSLREIKAKTTATPNWPGELFGDFQFDVADILAKIT